MKEPLMCLSPFSPSSLDNNFLPLHNQLYPGMHPKKCGQQAEGDGSSPSTLLLKSPPGVLHPTLGSPA